jgi:PAS domain S-box-containing protein
MSDHIPFLKKDAHMMGMIKKRNTEITWSQTLRIWWSYVWRCAVVSVLLGTAVYIGVIHSHDLDGAAGVLLALSVIVPVSIIMLKKIFQMRFKEFSIHLVSTDGSRPSRSEELAELRNEKEKLEDILSNISPDILMVVSPDRTIEVCNSSVERMFGYRMDEVIGKKTDMLYFDRRSNPDRRGEIYEVLEREGYHLGLATGKKKNEELISLEIITGKLRNRRGAVLLLRDISERKQLEDELEKHRDHLEAQVRERTIALEKAIEQLYRENKERKLAEERTKKLNEELELRVKERTGELEHAYEELKELDRMKDEFLSLVSHEFRTPLTSIMSFSEILMNYPEEDSTNQKEFLSIIHSESKRLTRLVNNVLDLSKIQARKMEWRFQKGDVKIILEKAIKSVKTLFAEKDLLLECDIDDELPSVIVDEDRIFQVLINLLSNAVKFTNKGGHIGIAAKLLDGEEVGNAADLVHISVSDTGIGILPEDLDRIFEPFRQCGDTLNEKPRGTGLGLSICREIMHAHRGNIWAESVYGQGSTFHIVLPIKILAMASSPQPPQQRMSVA